MMSQPPMAAELPPEGATTPGATPQEWTAPQRYYGSPHEQLRDWLMLVLLHVRRAIAQLQQVGILPLDPEGWHSDRIDRDEVRGSLDRFRFEGLLTPHFAPGHGDESGVDDVDHPLHWAPGEIESLQEEMRRKEQRTMERGLRFPLLRLRLLYELDERELLLLLFTLAPQLLGQLDRLYRFVQDDFRLGAMTPYLALRLIAQRHEDWLAWRPLFSDTAHLFRLGLLRWIEPTPIGTNPLHRGFLPGPGLLDYVAGGLEQPDASPPSQLVATLPTWLQPLELQLSRLLEQRGTGWLLVRLTGGGDLPRPLLTLLLRRLGLTPAWCEVADTEIAAELIPPLEAALRLAVLRREALVLLHAERLTQPPGAVRALQKLLRLIGPAGEVPLLLALGDCPWLQEAGVDQLELPLPLPPQEERVALWQRALATELTLEAGVDLRLFASAYHFSPEQITQAAAHALARARRRTGTRQLLASDLRAGCGNVLGQGLSRLATPVDTRHDFADLVLPDKLMRRLRELLSFVRNRELVLDQWGVGSKLHPRRGVAALYYGPPGTGKSLAASVVAGQLGMLLYRIDLSRVVDKYIGETEKRLEEIFRLAEESHAVLLFDEADALFSQRTGVRGSVDRYSNMEVNYLLQRLESFDGFAILTTNLPDSMDEAFKRRIDFKLEFPFPDQQQRETLWKTLWPKQVPAAKTLPFRQLAEDFELAGGAIRNAIVRACFWAAEGQQKVSGELLRRAVLTEAEEGGRLVREQ